MTVTVTVWRKAPSRAKHPLVTVCYGGRDVYGEDYYVVTLGHQTTGRTNQSLFRPLGYVEQLLARHRAGGNRIEGSLP